MNLNQYILCTIISRKILDIVLEEHPEIVTKAIQRTIEGIKEDEAISDFIKFVEKEKKKK